MSLDNDINDLKVGIGEIKTDIKHVISNQEEFKNGLKDHDCRINKLKSWQNKASGMAIIISIMIPIIILVI